MYYKFDSQFSYARRNGFTGTIEQYVKNQYKGYAAICKRCDIKKPLNINQWIDSK